jgi:osmotically-inducible protein OsmY
MKTDAQVQRDVLAELKWEPSINAAQIGVEVDGGIVTLAGHVDTYAEKWIAKRAVQRVAGVKTLAMNMEIYLPESSRRTDADIAYSATQVLRLISFLPEDSVRVIVEDGCVTLLGELASEYQRKTAAEPVCYLTGVLDVCNVIGIRPRAFL